MSEWTPLEQLAAYLDRTIESAMGMRSWLGPLLEHGGIVTSYDASPPDPSGMALAAARSAQHVEEALALLDEEDRRVLFAFYSPRGPYVAGGREHGAIVAVALAGPRGVRRIVEEAFAAREAAQTRALERIRTALRTGTDEDVRAELELAPLDDSQPPLTAQELLATLRGTASQVSRRNVAFSAALAALEDAQARLSDASDDELARARRDVERARAQLLRLAPHDDRRDAQRLRAKIIGAAHEALANAQAAFLRAWERRRIERRRERLERLRRTLEGP